MLLTINFKSLKAMKKLTITLILAWLLFLASNLTAQNTKGLFNLKEGDWFEIQVHQNFITTLNQSSNHLFQRQENSSTYLLSYQLKKQLSNGNQQYKIRLEHFKNIEKNRWNSIGYDFGYDSYYPTFDENKTKPEIKDLFNLEVTPNGKIVQFFPYKTNKSPKIKFTQIGSFYRAMFKATRTTSNSDSLMVRIFSSHLMTPDTLPRKISYDPESKIPLLIKQTDTQLVLTNASFPLPNNTVIFGTVRDQINQDVTISLIGENSDDYFPAKQFQTSSDGSFNCPIFMKRPLHLRIQIGNKRLTTFMEPGDTLKISAIGHQSREVEYNQYVDTKPDGYFSSEFKKTDYFSGSAAFNAMMSNELDQYRSGFVYEKEAGSVLINAKRTTKLVSELIDSYRGKASAECISYFESDFKYFLAVSKLYFEENHRSSWVIDQQNYRNPKFSQIEYPTDFFLEVDTIPILMNPFEWNSSYQNFIKKSLEFKQKRLGWSVSKGLSANFLENYFFLQASLQGYPLYSQIAKLIDLDLRHQLSSINTIEPYYQNFINNCADPVLVEPLKEVYERAAKLEIGKEFPIKSFVLQDSSIFNLERFKGKPICLIVLSAPKSAINAYKEEIIKFKQEDVNFIIARLPIEYMEGKLDSTVLGIQNVTYIELGSQDLTSKLLLNRSKIFMLDKWFRIVDNNAEDPRDHRYIGGQSKFEESLCKAIEAKRYSKAEKTAMLTIAGWSFGSVLFTFFIGWWFYRIRIRRIKKQEAVKRRIKELEIKAIRSQMNPHFIFNALNSIQSLINGNQFKEANIYLAKFAVLLRGVLNNSEKSRISLSDELQAVELYCQLEQLRFEFRFKIDIDLEVNSELIEIPGMIIQPLAENAVVHGLSAKGNQGELSILVKRQNGLLCVCVSDNGVGLSPEKIDTLSQKGFGLKLVEERINILNLDGKEARLTVENRQDSAGTLATLTIPID